MDYSIGYRLHQLSACIELLANRELMFRHGIGFSHFKVLVVLLEHEGIQQKTVAEYLLQTEASVSRVITELEKHGFVDRFKDSFDKRQNIIRLSHSGTQLAIDAGEVVNSILRDAFSRLSDDEQKSFLLSTKKMLDSVTREL